MKLTPEEMNVLEALGITLAEFEILAREFAKWGARERVEAAFVSYLEARGLKPNLSVIDEFLSADLLTWDAIVNPQPAP